MLSVAHGIMYVFSSWTAGMYLSFSAKYKYGYSGSTFIYSHMLTNQMLWYNIIAHEIMHVFSSWTTGMYLYVTLT